MTRVLVVSDVHANFEALRRISEDFDRVLCLGDLVDYGPDPTPCIRWMRDHDAISVRGNHDEALTSGTGCRCRPEMQEESIATRALMKRLLAPADVEYLATLPVQMDVVIDGVRCHLVHATPSDPLYTYLGPDQPRRWAEEAERVEADVLLVGHTHLPMSIRAGGKSVVNPGSVGQPRDGDPRAAFAVLEDGEPRLARVPYDVGASIRALERSLLPPPVAGRLAEWLRLGRVPARAREIDAVR